MKEKHKFIKNWLDKNNIKNWKNYVSMSNFQAIELEEEIYKICDSNEEVNDLKFEIKIFLSNNDELKEILKNLEYNENFEMCIKVLDRIKSNLD